MSKTILAWHFLPQDRRLAHVGGKSIVAGQTVRFDGPLKPCKSGLHASRDLWAALKYAPGPILCRVRCGGEMVQDTDKFVCRERTVIWMADATAMLREFARLCALDVIHLWDAPAIVIEYLKTGDESKRAAAWDAARAAARAAAWDAARAAAWAAARAAAWAAARAAARAAAWDAAEKKQQRRFIKMAMALRAISK